MLRILSKQAQEKITKESRGRRFRPEDRVRYFTDGRKGKGKGIVLTPNFARGTVRDYDSVNKRYVVHDDGADQEVEVHPRNIVLDTGTTAPVTDPVV